MRGPSAYAYPTNPKAVIRSVDQVSADNHEQLRRRVARYVRTYGLPAEDAARLTDEVVLEVHDEEWEADVNDRIEVARRRLDYADLLRRGLTLEQLDSFRIHYSR
jgi:Glu-tRNA(Gln) amidotransferase subunit E-like FAD-binding protein